jgi:hypothetical protein
LSFPNLAQTNFNYPIPKPMKTSFTVSVRNAKVASVLASVLILLGGPIPSVLAAPQSGSTAWMGWKFDWYANNPQPEFLVLRNVSYNGNYIMYKASMPVIRVRYTGGGPGPVYCDQLNWGNEQYCQLIPLKKVCQSSFTLGSRKWLVIWVRAKLGKYRLIHAYYFSNDGYFLPRLFSRGLHHPLDHDHHVYQRFDMDIKGAANDQVWVYNSPGTFWTKYTQELNTVKNPPSNRYWFFRDNPGGSGVTIYPWLPNDGFIDAFSTKDVGVRHYHGGEDGWPFGTGSWAGSGGHLGYDVPPENVAEADDVFWYVSHLHHQAALGPNQWLVCGPIMKVQP